MRAVGIVQTAFGNQEVVDDLPSQDGLGDDPGNILKSDSAVPDPLRVDHHRRTVLALVEAARVIGPGQGTEPGLPEFELEGFLERLEARWIAASPLMTRVANIAADENVMREGRHVSSHKYGVNHDAPGRDHTALGTGQRPCILADGHSFASPPHADEILARRLQLPRCGRSDAVVFNGTLGVIAVFHKERTIAGNHCSFLK